MNRIREGLAFHWEEIRNRLFHPRNTLRKFLNFLFVYAEARFSPFARSFGMPYTAYIDPASACNLKCPLCPTGMGVPTLKKGLMRYEVFDHILRQSASYLYEIRLYNWGEPLYNKDIFRMIRAATSRNVKVELSSNLNVFRDGMAAELVDSGLDELVVGLDGTTKETYGHYRVGGRIEKVLANVRAIAEEKARRGVSHPRIVWQFLVMRQNEHQVEEARERVKDWGFDELRLTWMRVNFYKELTVPLEQLLQEDREWIPTREEFTKYNLNSFTSKIERGRCLQPWYRLVIGWDGKIFPCCNMYDEDLNFGESEGQTLQTLRNNAKFLDSRGFLKRWAPSGGAATFCSKCQVYQNKRRVAKGELPMPLAAAEAAAS